MRNGQGEGDAGGGEASGSDGGGTGPIGKGGTTPNGGSSSGMGAASGGEPSTCFLATDAGPCRALIPRYAFDSSLGLCLPFIYGGCEGNANNFETPEACDAECGGQGNLDAVACNTPLDCTLIPSRCCGACDEATLQNTVAVNLSHTGVVQSQPSCAAVDCVTCDPPFPSPWLGATCRQSRCVAFDVRQTELTACTEPGDCRLRAGLGCCENCTASPENFVSINRTVNTEPLLCGGAPILCDACTPAVPPGLSAVCDGGRCLLSLVRE